MDSVDSVPKRVDLHIPASTYLKFGFAALLAAVIVKLAPLFALLIIAIILAVAVEPVILWCEAKMPGRFGRMITIGTIGLTALAVILFLGLEIFPPLANQISIVASKLPGYVQKHLAEFKYGPQIYAELESQFKTGAGEHAGAWFNSLVTASQMVFEGLGSVVLPIAASYPIIEKIWLRRVVEESALRDHADET